MSYHRIAAFLVAITGLASQAREAGASSGSSAQSPATPGVILLTGGTILDGTGGPPRENGWVRVEGETIAAVGQGATPAAGGAEVVNLAGKTIAPGLSDMHVHLGDLVQARWVLKLLLAHGVTNVKDTGNSLGNLAAIRRWIEGETAVPHLFVSGATLNGSGEELRFLRSGDFLRARLEDGLAFGIDFIKIHNWIATDGLQQIAEFAKKNDIYLTGHVPLSMTSVSAIDGGMTILEHVRMHASEFLDDPEILARYQLDLLVMKRTGAWAHLDPDGAALTRTLVALEKRKDRFFIDPTLVVQWALAHSDRPGLMESPEMKMVSPGLAERWKRSGGRQYGELDAEGYLEAKNSARGMGVFTGLLHGRGVRVLTGTDTPVTWVVPGASLHQELELLVEGGLSPVAAIHSSTGLASEALRKPDRGTIAAGKRADLIVVDGDLAADIRNVRKLEQVMLGGRLYPRSQLLEEASRLAAEDTPSEGAR